MLRNKYMMFWSASFGPLGGQGSVCMSIAEAWQPAIRDKVIVMLGRAQFVTMYYYEDLFGILNVYAPNHANTCAKFWARLAGQNF